MKKLFALLMLAAMPLMAHYNDNFGYYYVENAQVLSGSAAVLWDEDSAVNTQEVYLDYEDAHSILIEEKGYYLVTYCVTAKNDSDFSFALLLNGEIVPGSIYGTETESADIAKQLYGQALFQVTQKDSILQLVNNTGDSVALATVDDENVTASLFVQKLRRLRQ